MPQTPKEQAKAYVSELKAQGVSVQQETVSPLTLKPTQSEIDATKVGQMMYKWDAGKVPNSIFVSRDNYVLDGHHRWATAAAMAFDKPGAGIKIPVTRIMLGHAEALGTMHAFNKAHGIVSQPFGLREQDWTTRFHGLVIAARERMAAQPVRRLRCVALATPTTAVEQAQH